MESKDLVEFVLTVGPEPQWASVSLCGKHRLKNSDLTANMTGFSLPTTKSRPRLPSLAQPGPQAAKVAAWDPPSVRHSPCDPLLLCLLYSYSPSVSLLPHLRNGQNYSHLPRLLGGISDRVLLNVIRLESTTRMKGTIAL